MRLKNWHKSNAHRAFPQFCKEYTTLILCLSCRNILLIHRRLYFELNNKIIVIPWFPLLIFSTGNELGFQSSSGNMWQGYQKKLYFSQWQNITKFIQSMQFVCSNRTSAGSIFILPIHVIQISFLHMWYRYPFYMCDTYILFICVIQISFLHMWYIYPFYICDTYILFSNVIQMSFLQMWNIYPFYICDTDILFT